MIFDIYGHFELEIIREGDSWIAYRRGQGTRRQEPDLSIPSSLTEAELLTYLDDIYHEYAAVGRTIRQIKCT